MYTKNQRQRGSAMVMAIMMSTVLLALTLVIMESGRTLATSQRQNLLDFQARQAADSGIAHALASIKFGGISEPKSGGGSDGVWTPFDGAEYFYSTSYDMANSLSTIRAWGRVAAGESLSLSTVAPDNDAWESTGYIVRGLEVSIRSSKYIPEAALYFGNGGIEKPMGGFAWSNSFDPLNPETWGIVRSRPSSYQSSSLPFETSALDHPVDFLYDDRPPSQRQPAAALSPHPYSVWAAQTRIGQLNTEAWFRNSGGSGVDPSTRITPTPTTPHYSIYPGDPSYPYPVNDGIADVQSFAWDLWSRYSGTPNATELRSGSHSGVYGHYTAPEITMVTGNLRVRSGQTLTGSGVLLIRDDYDPNNGGNNTPRTRAGLTVDGTLNWTGLVIVAGWAPTIAVNSGGNLNIVGSLFGEDSVQSGGEVSLDSATIILRVRGAMRVLYSRAVFEQGGLIYDLLPEVEKEIVGIREL